MNNTLAADAVKPSIDAEWIGQSEPTPVDLLIAPADAEWESALETYLDHAECECKRTIPRFEVRVAGDPWEPSNGYHVWDRMNDREAGWCRWLIEAKAMAEDMNAEDLPEEEDLGEWWKTLPTDPDLDGWRYTLATEGHFPEPIARPSASQAWIDEGRARLRATGSTRGDLFGYDTADDDN